MTRLTDHLTFWGLCGFVLLTPILPDVKITRYKLTGMEVALALLAAAWLVEAAWTGELRWKASPIVLPALAYGLLTLGLFAASAHPESARSELERMGLCLAAFFLAANRVRPEWRRPVVGCWVVGTTLAAGYGLLQHTGGLGRIAVPLIPYPISTFGNSDFFAAYLVQLALVLAGCLWSGGRWMTREGLAAVAVFAVAGGVAVQGEVGMSGAAVIGAAALLLALALAGPERLAAGVVLLAFAACLASLYFTVSRAGWIGCLAGLIVFLLLSRVPRMVKVAVPVLLLAGFAVLAWARLPEWMRHTDRVLIWRDSLGMVARHPWLGVGIGAYHLAFPDYASAELLKNIPRDRFIVNFAHNEYLEIWAETGTIGLGLFLWLLAALVRQGRRAVSTFTRDRALAAGMLAACAAALVHNVADVNFRFIIMAVYWWFLMGLLVSLGTEEKAVRLGPPAWAWPRTGLAALVVGAGVSWAAPAVLQPYRAQQGVAAEPDFFSSNRTELVRETAHLERQAGRRPGDADTFYKLGWNYAKDRNWPRAIEAFEQAARLRPTEGVFNNLGNIYFTLGDKAHAVAAYRQAIAVNPGRVDAHFNLGYVYYSQGKLKEAAEEFRTVLGIDPRHAKSIVMLKKMTE